MKHKQHNNELANKSFGRTFKARSLIIILSLIFVIQPLFVITPAEAATSFNSFTVGQSVLSKYYFYSIESCLQAYALDGSSYRASSDYELSDRGSGQLTSDTIAMGERVGRTTTQIKAMDWFPKNMPNNVVSVSILEGDSKTVNGDISGSGINDSKVWCDENGNAMLKNAFALWGISAEDAFKNLVCSNNGVDDGLFFNKNAATDCSLEPSPTDPKENSYAFNYDLQQGDKPIENMTVASFFKKYIVDSVYGGDDSFLSGYSPSFSEIEGYWFNRELFNNFCITQDTLTSTVPSGDYFEVSLVNDKDNTISTGYAKNSGSKWWNANSILLWGASSSGYPLPGQGTQATTSCTTLVTNLNLATATNYNNSSAKKDTTVGSIDEITQGAADAAATTTQEKQTCGSQMTGGLGWIMCPIITGLAKLSDDVWNLVTGLLTVSPLKQSDSNGVTGVYKAWGTIRNIANIAFVIAFLVMIFSQLANVGLSNYGIKKLLPRLIIGAILINISFVIIQIAVDLSNVIGSSLYDLMVSIVPAYKPDFMSMIEEASIVSAASAVGVGTVLIVGFTGGVTTALWLLLPVLAMAVLGLIAALLTLIFRKAAIIVLAILAPLAIVASLLPNTESWYKKWKDEFLQMLMLFPLAALVFGGSQFAAGVIISQNTHDWFNHLVAIIVVIMPLFSLPFLAKSSGKIVGAVGKGLTDLANKAKSPMSKWTGEHADRARDRENNAAMNGSDSNPYRVLRRTYLRSKAKRDYSAQTQKGELSRSQSEFIAAEVEKNTAYRNKISAGSGEGADRRALASAINTTSELHAKEVKAAGTIMDHLNLDYTERLHLAMGLEVKRNGITVASGADDKDLREAAIVSAVPTLNTADLEKLLLTSGANNMTIKQRTALKQGVISSGASSKSFSLAAETLSKIEAGSLSTQAEMDSATIYSLQKGRLSAEKLALSDPAAIERMLKVARNNESEFNANKSTDPKLLSFAEVIGKLKEQSAKAQTDPNLSSKLTAGQKPLLMGDPANPSADYIDSL